MNVRISRGKSGLQTWVFEAQTIREQKILETLHYKYLNEVISSLGFIGRFSRKTRRRIKDKVDLRIPLPLNITAR